MLIVLTLLVFEIAVVRARWLILKTERELSVVGDVSDKIGVAYFLIGRWEPSSDLSFFTTSRLTPHSIWVAAGLSPRQPFFLTSVISSESESVAELPFAIGLAKVSPNLVKHMEEKQRIPPRADIGTLDAQLTKISQIIARLLDKDIFLWLESGQQPMETEVQRAATIVADRLCGAISDLSLRNAQERRQLAMIKQWLEQRGYSYVRGRAGFSFDTMQPRTFKRENYRCSHLLSSAS